MEDRILALARAAAGGAAEEPLLAPLCAAAGWYWEGRLREGLAAEDCGEAFPCAAAFTAAADLLAGGNGGFVESFRAGEISVKGRGAAETAAQAQNLRQTAERLMAPFAVPEDFSFQGVRG